MAEGTRLLSEYGDYTPSRVRIPPSPPFACIANRGPEERGRGRLAIWTKHLMRFHTRFGFELSSLPLRPGHCAFLGRYNLVILSCMKTAISLPDETFQRVDHAAMRLGVSRSEFFARAAERWLDTLEDDGTTGAINRVIAGLTIDHVFTDSAAAVLAAGDRIDGTR